METFLGFLLGVVTSIWFLGICTLLLIFTDSDDVDDTAFWPILASILIFVGVYLLGGIEWSEIKWYLAAYIPLGLVWSGFKYRKFCTKQARKIIGSDFKNTLEFTFTPSQKSHFDRYTSLKTLTGRISYWIIFWPLSVVSWAIRDLVVDVCNWLVNSVFQKLYETIRNSVIKNVRVVDPDIDKSASSSEKHGQ